MATQTVPTIQEIRASTTILSPPDASATVVRVGNFAVKYGGHTSLREAETLRFVSENTRVPTPKFFATFEEPETRKIFIVMEYIQGQNLADAWESLTTLEKRQVAEQLQIALEDLRALESPGYFVSVNRQALEDGIFWTGDYDPAISGPFETEGELNEGILKHLEKRQPPAHISLLRKLISTTIHSHRITFTHGDLQPKNILVQRIGSDQDSKLKVTIIDWEISGWYPEYWEFCSTVAGEFRPHWLDMVQQIMQIYPSEYLMLQAIRSLIFY